MQRKKGDLLRLKKRASESSAMEEGPSKRHAPHQGFRPLASVSASTSQLLCSLLLKNMPKTLPPLPPSELVQRSAAASDPYSQDSADEPEVEDKMYTWTPLPAPNMELLTKRNPIILSLEQLCAPINEPANPTCSSALPLSTIGGECPSMGTESGNHNMLHPLSSEVVASPKATNVSENNRADVLEVEGWNESDVALFDGEELDLVWRNIDLTVDDSSSDSSDGLPAVNLGRNLPPPGTSRDRHLASEEQCKQNYSNRTSSSGSHMTQPQVTRHDIVQKQEDRPTFCCPPKPTAVKDSSTGVIRQQLKLPTSSGAPCLPKTTTGKDLPTGPRSNQRSTYSRQQLKLPTSSDLLQTDSECSFKPAETQKDASSSYPSASHSSVGRGKQESVPRAPLVTESCPMCGTAFPLGYNQLDADHHIALCLERDLLLEDVAMLDQNHLYL